MKKPNLILVLAILFAITSTLLSSCSGAAPADKEATQESVENDHHEDGDGHDHHDHDEDGHGSDGHMQHMEDVRTMLKEELGTTYDEVVPPVTDEQLAMGAEVYKRTCATCHGDTGKGDGLAALAFEQKPADFTDYAHSSYYSDQGRIYIITNGVEGTPMVPMKSILKEEEIIAVHGYIRSLKIEGTTNGHEHEAGLYACPMHPDITSDEAGQKCSKCGMKLLKQESEHGHEGHEH